MTSSVIMFNVRRRPGAGSAQVGGGEHSRHGRGAAHHRQRGGDRDNQGGDIQTSLIFNKLCKFIFIIYLYIFQ